jgi:hypothetical protein
MLLIAKNLKVVDLAAGFASAVVLKLMIDNRATVTRVLPNAGDSFFCLYPAYESLKDVSHESASGWRSTA